MISSDATVVMMAILMLAAGTLSGWWLRGQCLGRSLGNRKIDLSFADQEDFTSATARRDQETCDSTVWPSKNADADEATHDEETPPATVRAPIGDETAIPCVRNTFSLALGHRLAESARTHDPLSLILVRIDNYQRICDRYGLSASNQILDAAGKFFIASVRGMDWVARFDMTTFAFLLPKTTHTNSLCVAERLRTTVSAARFSVEGTMVSLTISLGTTEAIPGDNSEAILRRAEEAMNASIQMGGDRIHSRTSDQFASARAV